MASTHHKGEFVAALTGLVVGGCVVFALLFGVVTWTNHKYAGESHTAEATK